ncbi:hypothetical protein ACLOJK_002304 [Asimina triloba]
MVLGTFNIGDQGDGMVPDLTRIIGAVLNSVGVGNASTGGVSNLSTTAANTTNSMSQVTGRGASQGNNNGGVSQTGNQVPSGPGFLNVPFQSLQQSFQFPFPGVLAVPSLQAIPDSLTTLSEFINRMELALSDNGYQSSQTVNAGNPPTPENASSNSRGLPVPEGLSAVMRRAQQLLCGPAGSALSSIAGRIEREGGTTDPVTREQIQSQAVQIGVAMQHLGALLLELGRTMMMLRMGQSPAESVVNAGPAVYISSAGPNPIMVQQAPYLVLLLLLKQMLEFPVPLVLGMCPETSVYTYMLVRKLLWRLALLLVKSSCHDVFYLSGTTVAPGLSSVGSRASTGEAVRVQNPNQAQATANVTGLVNSGPVAVLPVRNVVAAVPGQSPSDAAGHVLSVFYPVQARSQLMNPNHTTPAQGSSLAGSSGVQLGVGSSVLQSTSQSVSPPTVLAQSQMHARDVDSSRQGENACQTANMINSGQGPQVLSGPSVVSAVEGSSTRPSSVSVGIQPSDNIDIDGTGHSRVVAGSLHYNPRADNEGHQMEDSTVSSSMTQTPLVSLQGDFTKADSHVSSSETSTNAFVSGTTPSSSQNQVPTEGDKTAPLGLGSGGLQPKRRSKQVKVQGKDGGTGSGTPANQNQQSIARDQQILQATAANQNQQSIARGQQFLQALASRGSSDISGREQPHTNDLPAPPVFHQIMDSMPLGRQDGNGQNDAASMMSQLLRSPALDSLLEGVSQQAGIGSPAGLRSMMEQLTQSPSVRNTINQIARDVGGQDIGNMFPGSGRDQGGIDFSRMFQQLMPVVSQALGQGPTLHAPSQAMGSDDTSQHDEDKSSSNGVDASNSQFLIDLHQAVERIESHESPTNLFRTVVQTAGHLYGDGNASEDLVEELCSNSTLANEFMVMLQRDINHRLQSESRSPGDKSNARPLLCCVDGRCFVLRRRWQSRGWKKARVAREKRASAADCAASAMRGRLP